MLVAAAAVSAGDYYGPTKLREMARGAGPASIDGRLRDEDVAASLWELSMEFTEVSYLVG